MKKSAKEFTRELVDGEWYESTEAIKEAVQLAKQKFKTKAVRKGKVLPIRHLHIDYYAVGSKQIFTLNWPAL